MNLVNRVIWTIIYETEDLQRLSEVGFEPTPPIGDHNSQL